MMLYQLEPNDNISVTDSKYGTTGSALYSIQSINSDQGTSKSEASYGITPFRPYPSFQPAVQANLADYDNEPIVNARIEIIDDAGKVISVKEYTETSPFDPYLCDPDKGEYRIRITWDQIVDGIVYINVYNELGDIVRGGNSNIKDQEKNGRLFNKPVDAGLNRMEIWDCTSNLSYYSYKPDEEIPANLDSPPSAELYFEFVHIDRSGIIRKVSTDNKDIKHSETDQKLWVQLGDKIEIAEISVDNAFNMSYLKKFNGNGGAGLDGGYVNIANNVIPAENIRIPDGEDRPNAIKIRTRVLKNVANSTEDGLRIQVNRQRLFYGQFKIMTVPHITFDGIYNLTVQGTGVERNASLNHWYKGIDFKKGMFSYWNYTDPDAWADISNQISEMDGKDRWPNTEYSIVFNINDLAGIDSSDTKELFNTDTAAYESKLRGRISDPYFHNWRMTLYNDSNNDPLPTNSAVFYPTASRTSAVDGHSELMHFKRNKDLVVDEVINIRVTVRDNSGWRYAVSNVTAHVRESRDTTNMVHAEIGENNVYGQWKRWAWDWNGNWILGQPMTYSNEPTPQTFYEGRPGGRLQGGGTPFANYFYNVSGGPNPDARKRRIV